MSFIQHQAARSSENFPVASWLLPRFARKPILACYDFLRGADDIADNPSFTLEQRRQLLLDLANATYHQTDAELPYWARAYAELAGRDATVALYGQRLIQAFLQDTQQQRYETLDDLLGYCTLSAAPVGRLVLHLCQEPHPDLNAADALCAALQLLNHAQHVKSDCLLLNRVYLPHQWLRHHQVAEADLTRERSSEGVRNVLRQLLDIIAQQLQQAAYLPATIQSHRLQWEIRWILALANELLLMLRHYDPLAYPIKVGRCRGIWLLLKLMVRR